MADAPDKIVEFRSAEERDRMAEIRTAASVLIERMQFARQAGITFNGARDLYEVLGYTRILTLADYCDRYARGGIAKRIIECLPKASWRGGVEVIEDEDPEVSTAFESEAEKLNTRLNAHAYLERADVLSQLGYYAVLLIGAPGRLDEELPKGNGKSDNLKYFQPYAGGGGPGVGVGGFNKRNAVGSVAAFGDATIMSFDTDIESDRFGLPLMYQLRRSDIATDAFTQQVHWSRIIHLAEGCLDNDVYGVPSLEAVWNDLDNLEKVTGGGSEAFWIKANAGLHADVSKDMGLPGGQGGLTPDERNRLKDQMEEYQHKINRVLLTRGVTVSELSASPSDFSSEADAIITQIAGTKGIPKRVLTGSEMGELASSQDRENFKDIVNGRQAGYVGPYVVKRFYDRLILYNYLPKPAKYEVKWAHIQTLTEQEKAEGASKWASVNATQGDVVFTEAEIRSHWYQLEPLSEEDSADNMTEMDKARGAMLWASANKTMGEVVFTNDEIRDRWEQMPPLKDEQKTPIATPVKGGAGVEQPQAGMPMLPKGAPEGTPLMTPPEPLPKLVPQSISQMHAGHPVKEMPSGVQKALETAIAVGKVIVDTPALRAAMDSGDQETVATILKTSVDAVVQALEGPGHPFHGNQWVDEFLKEDTTQVVPGGHTDETATGKERDRLFGQQHTPALSSYKSMDKAIKFGTEQAYIEKRPLYVQQTTAGDWEVRHTPEYGSRMKKGGVHLDPNGAHYRWLTENELKTGVKS